MCRHLFHVQRFFVRALCHPRADTSWLLKCALPPHDTMSYARTETLYDTRQHCRQSTVFFFTDCEDLGLHVLEASGRKFEGTATTMPMHLLKFLSRPCNTLPLCCLDTALILSTTLVGILNSFMRGHFRLACCG